MKENLQWFGIVVIVIVCLSVLSYIGFKTERWFHYKFGYQDKVQEEVQPVLERLNDLERRVLFLETNQVNNLSK